MSKTNNKYNCDITASTLIGMFLDVIKKHGPKTSLMEKIDGKYEGFSYHEFGERVKNFALGLASLGVEHSDCIALISENRPEWPVSDLGMLSMGAINVPLYTTLTPEQIEYILNDSETTMIIVSTPELLEKVMKIYNNLPLLKKVIYMEGKPAAKEYLIKFEDIYAKGKLFAKNHPDYYNKAITQVKPDDLCGIIYTSGTTGAPKGVMLSHNNVLSNVKAGLSVLSIDETDILLSFLPLCHSYERTAGQFAAIAAGATIAYAESVEKVAENLTEVKPTVMTTVPRLLEKVYARIMDNVEAGSSLKKKIFWWAIKTGEKYNQARSIGKISGWLNYKHNLAYKLVFRKLHEKIGGRLRFFVSAAAALSKSIAEFFYKAGILVLEAYGLTETSPAVTMNHEENFKFGSVGPTLPEIEVKIAKDGEILTRGPHVMKGYYKNPEATAEMIDKDDWLHTGDIGFLDDEDFLYITDRKKNIIVTSGGKNVTPATIENLLILSPYIEQVIVIGDKHNFLTALIVPSFDNIKNFAIENNLSYTNLKELVNNEKIYELINTDVQKLTNKLARFEQIKKFTLLTKEFTIDSGELTPTHKVKRKVILQKHLELIEQMYQ